MVLAFSGRLGLRSFFCLSSGHHWAILLRTSYDCCKRCVGQALRATKFLKHTSVPRQGAASRPPAVQPQRPAKGSKSPGFHWQKPTWYEADSCLHEKESCCKTEFACRCRRFCRTVHNDGGLQVVDDTEFDEEYEEVPLVFACSSNIYSQPSPTIRNLGVKSGRC